MKSFIVFLAFLCAVGRFFITPRLDLPTFTGCYESFAHLFIGFLIGIWSVAAGDVGSLKERKEWSGLCAFLVVTLTLLEIIAFAVQKNAG